MKNIKNHKFDSGYIESLNYETPFFLFDQKLILRNYHKFKDCYQGSRIYYAMKANSEVPVLKLLADDGCGFEVASVYELRLLKKLRVPPEKIIYGTSIKPSQHIEEFYNYGVNIFAFDSLQELEKIASYAPRANVYVRIIANDSGSVFKFSEKFGTNIKNAVNYLLRARELGLVPYGISFHVGSQASDPEAWANAIKIISPVLIELRKSKVEIKVLNLGGGYPCDYGSNGAVPKLEDISTMTLKQVSRLSYEPQLILEPGRGIVADTGILVASVIARVERNGNNWLFLDAGCYNGLFEAMAYQGSTRYPIHSIRPIGDSGESLFALAGPTGDAPDIISREVLLPSDIDVGDRLVIANVGAYSLTVTSTFNGFPKPNVYFV